MGMGRYKETDHQPPSAARLRMRGTALHSRHRDYFTFAYLSHIMQLIGHHSYVCNTFITNKDLRM